MLAGNAVHIEKHLARGAADAQQNGRLKGTKRRVSVLIQTGPLQNFFSWTTYICMYGIFKEFSFAAVDERGRRLFCCCTYVL